MMKWAVAWLVVGLATPALGQPISKWGGKRAIASEGTRASFSPDGPWFGAPAPGFWPLEILEVHDDTGARVQFVERAGGIEVVLYADRATLRSVALADAVLSPSEAAARRPFGDRNPGMVLEPGTELGDVTPAADHLVKVHVQVFGEGGELRITGYVPAASVGTVYREREASEHDEEQLTLDVSLPRGFKLRDAPGGAVFVVSKNTDRVTAMKLQRDKGFTLVRLSVGVVGWIASSQATPILEPVTRSSRNGAVLGGLFGGNDEPNTLPVGTPLYDAVDGRAVGTVANGFHHRPVKQEAGWMVFEVPTKFAILPLWARAVTAAPAASSRPAPGPPK